MANAQLDFFNEKLAKIKNSLPVNNMDPMEILNEALDKWDKTASREVFNIEEITEVEMLEALKTLGNSTSCGMEGLDSISLKLLAPLLSRPLTHIANLSIRNSTFATKWKTAKVVPIYKGKDLPRNKT